MVEKSLNKELRAIQDRREYLSDLRSIRSYDNETLERIANNEKASDKWRRLARQELENRKVVIPDQGLIEGLDDEALRDLIDTETDNSGLRGIAKQILSRRSREASPESQGIADFIPVPQERPHRPGDSFGLNRGFAGPAAEQLTATPPVVAPTPPPQITPPQLQGIETLQQPPAVPPPPSNPIVPPAGPIAQGQGIATLAPEIAPRPSEERLTPGQKMFVEQTRPIPEEQPNPFADVPPANSWGNLTDLVPPQQDPRLKSPTPGQQQFIDSVKPAPETEAPEKPTQPRTTPAWEWLKDKMRPPRQRVLTPPNELIGPKRFPDEPPIPKNRPAPPTPDDQETTTQQDAINDLETRLRVLKEFFPTPPERPAQPVDQGSEKDRMRYMAQLALAGGLTAAGGPGWRQIGQGFSNAASVYGRGFDRYQKAMQRQADLDYRDQVTQYEYDMKLRELALGQDQAALERRQKNQDAMWKRRMEIFGGLEGETDEFGLGVEDGLTPLEIARMKAEEAFELYEDDIPPSLYRRDQEERQ